MTERDAQSGSGSTPVLLTAAEIHSIAIACRITANNLIEHHRSMIKRDGHEDEMILSLIKRYQDLSARFASTQTS